MTDLRAPPKIDLHRHPEGALRAATANALEARFLPREVKDRVAARHFARLSGT